MLSTFIKLHKLSCEIFFSVGSFAYLVMLSSLGSVMISDSDGAYNQVGPAGGTEQHALCI